MEPLPLSAIQLQSFVVEGTGSRPYRATRDMKRVHEAVREQGPGSCHVAVVELEHAAST